MNQAGKDDLNGGITSSPDYEYDDPNSILITAGEQIQYNKEDTKGFQINNIKLMADEVNFILNSMETYMDSQRRRRLEKLKPPSRMSRNWYLAALAVPITGYVAYKLTRGNIGSKIATEVYAKICTFFAEHVSEPVTSM